MFYFYILVSKKTGRYYIGSTSNLVKRLKLHNSGKVTSTKSFTPWRVAYSRTYNTLNEARKMEVRAKGWKSRDALERLIKHLI